MSRQGIAAFCLTALAASVALAGGPAVAADSCLDQVRDLSSQYGAPSKPPTAAPNGKAEVTTNDLARSGGVIAPPPVQDKSVITPSPSTRDAMPTVPDVASNNKSPSKPDQDQPEAARTQVQAALVAARAAAERGDDKGCIEALGRAHTLADRAN